MSRVGYAFIQVGLSSLPKTESATSGMWREVSHNGNAPANSPVSLKVSVCMSEAFGRKHSECHRDLIATLRSLILSAQSRATVHRSMYELSVCDSEWVGRALSGTSNGQNNDSG